MDTLFRKAIGRIGQIMPTLIPRAVAWARSAVAT